MLPRLLQSAADLWQVKAASEHCGVVTDSAGGCLTLSTEETSC